MEWSYAGRLNVSIMPRVHQGMEKQVSNMGSQKRSKQSAVEGIPIDYLSNTYQHVFTYVNTGYILPYIHTYICTLHTCICTYVDTDTKTSAYNYMHIHIHIHACIQTYIQNYTYNYMTTISKCKYIHHVSIHLCTFFVTLGWI
jgi:hypothetical protein